MADPIFGFDRDSVRRIAEMNRQVLGRRPDVGRRTRRVYPSRPGPAVTVASGDCCNAMCNPWKSIHGAPLVNCSVCGLAPQTYYVDFRLVGITDCCQNLGYGYNLVNETLDGCVWVSREFACDSAASGTAQWVLTISSTHSTLVCDLGGGNQVCYEKWGPWCCVSTNTMMICCGPYFCSNFPELVCVVPRTPSFPSVSSPCNPGLIVPGLLQLTIDVENCTCPAFPLTVDLAWDPVNEIWISQELTTNDITGSLQCLSAPASPAGTSGFFVSIQCVFPESYPDPENYAFILRICCVHVAGGEDYLLVANRHPGWSASPFNLEFDPIEEGAGVDPVSGAFVGYSDRICGDPYEPAIHKIYHLTVVEA